MNMTGPARLAFARATDRGVSVHGLFAVLAAATVFGAGPAIATYSIAAADTATKQVGGAGASCVGTLSVSEIYGSVPGKGLVHAQAELWYPGKARALSLIEVGTDPSDIVVALTDPTFDPDSAIRQYGLADVQGRTAGFTGSSALLGFKDDLQGRSPDGRYAYSTQGNTLTSVAVVSRAASAFENAGCDLADKLMLALEAAGADGEGDARCTPLGIPADGAFIEVDLEGQAAGIYLRLRVDNTLNGPPGSDRNPVSRLRADFEAWRRCHPCGVTVSTCDQGDGGGCGGCASSSSSGGAILVLALLALFPRRSRLLRLHDR
jgi:uncharacterized Ntn-hydrolase superfamily protein